MLLSGVDRRGLRKKHAREASPRIFSIPKIRRVAERLTHHATGRVRLDKSMRDRRRGENEEGGEVMRREETSPYAAAAIGQRGSDKARSVKRVRKKENVTSHRNPESAIRRQPRDKPVVLVRIIRASRQRVLHPRAFVRPIDALD